MNEIVKNTREVRETLVNLKVKVSELMEEPTVSYRELDIISQKIEEAIMWTYRVVAIENMDKVNSGEDMDIEKNKKYIERIIKALDGTFV